MADEPKTGHPTRWRAYRMRRGDPCYLCGVRPGISKDHVPPKTFFPDPARWQLRTVRACIECNRGASLDEEYVRDCLALVGYNEAAQDLFWNATVRSIIEPRATLTRATKLDQIKRDIRQMTIRTPAGLVLGHAPGLTMDMERVKRVVLKIVKGLHVLHVGTRIPNDADLHIGFEPPRDIVKMIRDSTTYYGHYPKVFHYRSSMTAGADGVRASLWLLVFFERLLVVVGVDPTHGRGPHPVDEGPAATDPAAL